MKTKPTRSTWSQIKRARTFLFETPKGFNITGPKSPLHVARIVRRKLSRVARKQQAEAAAYAATQRANEPNQAFAS